MFPLYQRNLFHLWIHILYLHFDHQPRKISNDKGMISIFGIVFATLYLVGDVSFAQGDLEIEINKNNKNKAYLLVCLDFVRIVKEIMGVETDYGN